jgi:hypothetical protein
MDRRQFLYGSGACLAIPTLASAGAQITGEPRRLVAIGNHLGYYPGTFTPKDAGLNYTLSPTLQPLAAHKKDFTVFSHLDHGIGGGHSGVHAFLSGVKHTEAAGFAAKNMTIDQAAAEHVGSATRFPSIVAGLDRGTDLSWNRAGVRIPPVNKPARLFEALFVEPSDARRAKQKVQLSERGSILDALRQSANTLNRQLDKADRDKLDQYLTSVREVERNLQMSKVWANRPKPKSPIPTIEDGERPHLDEVPMFYDLLTLALQTDSTRVATMEFPMGVNTNELDLMSYHALSHHGKDESRLVQLAVIETYLFEQYARFLTKLKETKTATGASLFDNTAVIMGSGMSDGSRHSNRDLPVVLAGGGIKHQGHVVCPEEDHKRIPLSNLWLSTLQWFGVETEQFGRSTGTFTPMELA